jgi:hypothetical protein
VAAGGVRIIEYEILLWSDLEALGDLFALLSGSMQPGSDVGILRCVVDDGRKVTFAGDGGATRALVARRTVGTPNGVALRKKDFPVMMEGWPYRLRNV